MSSGIGESNRIIFSVVGCLKPRVLACNACLGKTLKQLSTNCLYFVKLVPFMILSPPYSHH